MTFISLDRVTKRFGRTTVVDRVSLSVQERELFVLLGTSGSGKSTVLRMMAGLVEPDSGRVVLRGRDVTDLPPQARGTGFVFQDYSLFRHMTVGANVEFGLLLRGVRKRERRDRSEELLDLVGLGGHATRHPDQLSGGQQQRVALARALAYRPDVLLLDEPFGALDAKTRIQLRRTLKEIQATVGVTTILVTHDQDEAFELAHRIGVLDRGRLLEVAEPEQLYRAPHTHFAATFVGAGTVLVGQEREGKLSLGAATLALPALPSREEGSRVHVLVRPEQVVLSDVGSSSADVVSLGEGVVVEEAFAGGMRRLRVALPRPTGVRQLSPPLPFGEERLLLDAAVPSEAALADGSVHVGIRGWHVLDPAPPKLLVPDPRFGAAALEMADALAKAVGGSVSVLGVAADAEGVSKESSRLADDLATRGMPRAEVRVRTGDLARQLLLEQHQTFHDLVFVSPVTRGPASSRPDCRRLPVVNTLGPVVEEILADPVTPLVFVPVNRPLRRLLVCTAVGEPGEHAVRLGGWLARRLHARVTLLHILQGTAAPGARAQLHLSRAEATLRAMDVVAGVELRPAPTAALGIIEASEAGDHDMVVMGHRGQSPGWLVSSRDNVTSQVLEASNRPVLVVTGEATR